MQVTVPEFSEVRWKATTWTPGSRGMMGFFNYSAWEATILGWELKVYESQSGGRYCVSFGAGSARANCPQDVHSSLSKAKRVAYDLVVKRIVGTKPKRQGSDHAKQRD